MAKGRPDWYSNVALSGQYDTTLIPVLVDSNGNIIARIKGIHDSTLKDIALDTDGQMIMVPRGQSGNYMGVDASGYLTSIMKGAEGDTLRTVTVDSSGNIIGVMKGLEGANLRTLAVDSGGRIVTVLRDPTSDQYLAIDASGNIVAVMKGDFGGVLKTIAVDTNGVMKANISVQDLSYLTFRPGYGEAKSSKGYKSCGASATTTLFTLSGQGVSYGGFVYFSHSKSAATCKVQIVIDGTELVKDQLSDLSLFEMFNVPMAPLYLLMYDPTYFNYTLGVKDNLTFETSFQINVENTTDTAFTVYWGFPYALVPY